MNVGSLLSRHARYRPGHTALVCGEQRLAYAELDRQVNRLAHALLGAGYGKGDRLATLMPNSVELLLCYWACAKTGIAVVPLSPLLQAPALAGLLRDSECLGLVTTAQLAADLVGPLGAELPELARERILSVGGEAAGTTAFEEFLAGANEAPPADPGIVDEDVFNIIYSSGTTGHPKGIVHSHYVRAMYCTLFASCWRMTPESVVLHTGSIVFNGAFVTLMPTLFTGACYVLDRSFDAGRLIATVEREGVTHLMLVPSQIVALLNHPDFDPHRLASLQMILSLGAPLHLEHKQRLAEALPKRFHELYGLTEGFVTILDREDFAAKPDSVGVPPPFFEMRILAADGRELPPGEVGEICGRGPLLMPGYHNRPDLTAQAVRDGWLHTGDLGYVDEDGFLYLVDRAKDLIISGGVNVYPRDIEEVLVRHPQVREAAVFGVPSERWGETPVAAVVPTAPGAIEADLLRDWVNQRLGARYQRLSDLVLVEDFPRNVAGKTLKRELRRAYLGEA